MGDNMFTVTGASAGQIIERFEEYAIKVIPDSHSIGFEVKRITGETLSPPPAGLWLYERPGGSSGGDDTTIFDDGEMFLDGSIKWDGCSNWCFHTEDCMAHFCGRRDATSIGRLMEHLYDITRDRLPTYDREVAE